MAQINWTIRAKADLKEIFDYISKDSVKYAFHQVSKLKKATEILRQKPNCGRMVPEYNLQEIRELIVGNYRIIYWIVSVDKIDILAVHHGAKNLIKYI